MSAKIQLLHKINKFIQMHLFLLAQSKYKRKMIVSQPSTITPSKHVNEKTARTMFRKSIDVVVEVRMNSVEQRRPLSKSESEACVTQKIANSRLTCYITKAQIQSSTGYSTFGVWRSTSHLVLSPKLDPNWAVSFLNKHVFHKLAKVTQRLYMYTVQRYFTVLYNRKSIDERRVRVSWLTIWLKWLWR